MMFTSLAAVLLFTLGSITAQKMCPEGCSCPLDEKGRWQVLCLKGGLSDPLPVLKMPSEAEILIVSAPGGKTNSLTLGPIFRGLQKLEQIHVVNSQVPALGEHSFWGLKKLSVLNISRNSITALLPTNFRGPEELEILDLSHNNIESSPSAVFRYLKHLKALDISYNRMPELVPRIFFGLSELLKLDLSFNPLGNLPHDRFSDLPLLTELRCSGCGLLKVEQSLFKELQHLNSLDLSNNRFISIIPIKIASELSKLTLSGNHITKIQKESLQGAPLQEFHISHNRISSIEEGTFENSSLKILNIAYNRISVLDSKVLEPILSGLKLLDFSGNSLHIDQLQQILPKARQLRDLGIGDLGLTRLPGDLLRRSRHLKTLNISSNYISKFPHQLLFSTPHLQTLDLSANSFRGLNEHVVSAFKAMSSLTSVRLERNPWQCEECHISFLLNWLKSSTKQPHSISSCKKDSSSIMCLKCVGPEKYAGQPVILLNDETLDECTSEDQSMWPIWEGGNGDIVQSDQPRSSVNKMGNLDDSKQYKTVGAFFKDHLALLVGVACGLVLAMMLVVVTALACSKRQSAYYYTSEEDVERKEKLMGRNNNESPVTSPTTIVTNDPTVVPSYEPMAISKVHSRTPICSINSSKMLEAPITTSILSSTKRPKLASIATIEEVASMDM